MSKRTCFLPKGLMMSALAISLVAAGTWQAVVATEFVGDAGSAPTVFEGQTYSAGSFFSRELGTALRFGYHTEGYGTQEGVVSLGTMKVFNMDGAAWFLDGQGTLSNDFGGGFNIGLGYREMVNLNRTLDAQRIYGASFWTDGQSTSANNFFTQLSFGLESLGDSYDLRMSGYFPLDRTKSSDPRIIDLGTPVYQGNQLFGGLEQFFTDTAHSVIDAEYAKRVADLEAWAFAGVYHLGGGGVDDTGYRVGMRGYALPDLALSLQVTDDRVYNTNVMFGITWFVGRTHRNNMPVGTVLDRFREPVIRNDFIATTQQRVQQAAGLALADASTGDPFHIVHVDSNAAPGGTGTFESPANTLASAQAQSEINSIVLAYADSVFTGNYTAQNGQRILGLGVSPTGDPVTHIVDSVQFGTFALPEPFPGAAGGATPIVNGVGDVFTLADNNELNNFIINGGTNAVVADGVTSPLLRNLDINDPTNSGLLFTDVTGTATVANTVSIERAGGTAIHIEDGAGTMNVNASIVENTTGRSVLVQGRTGGSVNFGGTIDDTGEGILLTANESTSISFTDTVTLDTGSNTALEISGNNTATSITFADLDATSEDADTVLITGSGTVNINNVEGNSQIVNTGTGNAVTIVGEPVAADNSIVNIAADIENSVAGNAVNISARAGNNVTFSGEINDTAEGLSITGNSGGTIAFNGPVTTDTGANNGITMTGNSGTAVIRFSDIDLTTTSGTAMLGTGGGTLVITSPDGTNTINTDSGQAIVLNGMTIGNDGVAIDEVNVEAGTSDSISLTNLNGTGLLRIGSGEDPGDGGEITTTGTAIVANNVNNLAVNNIRVENTTGRGILLTNQDGGTASFNGVEIETTTGDGVVVEGNSNGTANFNSLVVNTEDGNAVTVQNNTGGIYNFTDLEATTTGTGDAVVLNNNTGATVNVNGMEATASGTGNGFRATGGGTVSVTGDTSVDVQSGNAINMANVTVGPTGATLGQVNVAAGTGDSVILNTLAGTGQVIVGSDATDPGTINTAGRAVFINNGNNNITVNTDVNVTDAAGRSLEVTNRTGGAVNFNGTVTDQGGMRIANNTGGSINVTDDMTFNTGGNTALAIEGNSGAVVNISGDIDLDTTSGTGVHLSGTNSNVSISGDISGGTGTSLEIEGNATAVVSGDITNTDGLSLHVHNLTGGIVNINGDINDTGDGISIDSNTGGTVNMNGNVNLNTGASDALTITGNTAGNTVNFSNSSQIDIETTSGRGMVVSGAGAVNVNGTGHTIDTDTGIGVDVTNARSATFNNLTINSTNSDAVNVTHTVATVSNVRFNNLDIESAGGVGFSILANGSGQFDVTLDNAEISDVGQQGILLETGANLNRVDFVLTNSEITADDASAFQAVLDLGVGDIRFLIQDNLMSNNSATNATSDILLASGSVLNATIGSTITNDPGDPVAPPAAPIGNNNRFRNTAAGGDPFAIEVNNAAATLNLDLRDNTAQGGTVEYVLTQTTGTFNLVDATDTINGENNIGTVNATGTINNINPPVAQPTP